MPFADPFRLRVLKELTALLQTITVANGYKHDLDEAVFRGRLYYGDDDVLPMISILESPLPLDQLPTPTSNPNSSGEWEIVLQGFAQDDAENPTDPAYSLIADVKQALTKHRCDNARDHNLLNMGGCVIDIKVGSGVVRPSDDISSRAYFWMSLNLEIAEDLAKPYD